MARQVLVRVWEAFKADRHSVLPLCRFQQDELLGVASIPLSPLLQESWVQGTAPVLAVMTKADSQTQDRVQVTSPPFYKQTAQVSWK